MSLLGTNTITIGGSNYTNSGYLGLNNQNPRFHLDINTPNPGGATFGEMLLRCRITDDPDLYPASNSGASWFTNTQPKSIVN